MHLTRPDERDSTRPRFAAILSALAAALAVVLGACGDDDSGQASDSDPTGVIEDFYLAYNRNDIDTAMTLFADESVITGHPMEPDQRGLGEIRRVLAEDRANAAADDPYEISNVEVTGDTVTWDHVWTRGDGVERCVDGHSAIVDGDKIMAWTWPDTDFDCP